MTKYIVEIDMRNEMRLEHKELTAGDFREALKEAECFFDPETVYCIFILEKTGKTEKAETNITRQRYDYQMRYQGHGWFFEGSQFHVDLYKLKKGSAWFEVA